MGWLVMEQRQSPHTSLDSNVDDVVRAPVAPPATGSVFIGRVLGVLDQQLHAADELDQAAVTAVHVPAAETVLHYSVWLVVGDVGNGDVVGLDAVAHAH